MAGQNQTLLDTYCLLVNKTLATFNQEANGCKNSKVMLTAGAFQQEGGIKGVAVKDRLGFKFQNVN